MVQKGTKDLAIIVVPRIDGKVVTQMQIKTIYSNAFINDTDTPLDFGLELVDTHGALSLINWDEAKSGESKIYFPVPDSVYENIIDYTMLCFWTIGVEKIYTINPFNLIVEDKHNGR